MVWARSKEATGSPNKNSDGLRSARWTIKPTNMTRLDVDSARGVLLPKRPPLWLPPMKCSTEYTNSDRIAVEWCNTPEEATKQFRHERFQGHDMIQRNKLPTEHNP
ncbi:hypothetical protein TELCIR_11152 [Teladorsagia circumcincta]|uniref:Uncharacterized protein n=1 Tax=Teladorsagia circumcincta TaxID=45464 RepID=A0A2G9UA74_TELCI|nr:hypothetical protein TELCIR_11152 [Teladorsagia circumcincta]